MLAVQWSVKYFFAPNSSFEFAVIPEKWRRKEEEERQLRSFLLFNQTQISGCFKEKSYLRFVTIGVYVTDKKLHEGLSTEYQEDLSYDLCRHYLRSIGCS